MAASQTYSYLEYKIFDMVSNLPVFAKIVNMNQYELTLDITISIDSDEYKKWISKFTYYISFHFPMDNYDVQNILDNKPDYLEIINNTDENPEKYPKDWMRVTYAVKYDKEFKSFMNKYCYKLQKYYFDDL